VESLKDFTFTIFLFELEVLVIVKILQVRSSKLPYKVYIVFVTERKETKRKRKKETDKERCIQNMI